MSVLFSINLSIKKFWGNQIRDWPPISKLFSILNSRNKKYIKSYSLVIFSEELLHTYMYVMSIVDQLKFFLSNKKTMFFLLFWTLWWLKFGLVSHSFICSPIPVAEWPNAHTLEPWHMCISICSISGPARRYVMARGLIISGVRSYEMVKCVKPANNLWPV